VKIGIIGAMTEEIEPLLEALQDVQVHEYAQNRFYEARYNALELVIVYSKIGKVNSALSATLLIEKFGAEKVIFTGVAGAIDESLAIGDLVVATELVQHDVDITAFGHPYGFIPESGDFIKADDALIEVAKNAALALDLKLLSGVIATGDQFIASAERKNWIRETYSASALEMEGASVAYVCQNLNVPFCVLRAISDAADGDAGMDFDTFLKESAKNSAQFVFKMLDQL